MIEPSHDSPLLRGVLLRGVFRFYKGILSPVLHAVSPAQCKFLPTCSEYAVVAVARHGVWEGSMLALRRLARCHPFAVGGLDPVPAVTQWAKEPTGPYGGSKPKRLS